MTGPQVARWARGIEFRSARQLYRIVQRPSTITSPPLGSLVKGDDHHTHTIPDLSTNTEVDEPLLACQACCAVVFEADIDKHAQYHTSNDEWYRPLPDDPTI